MDAPLPDDFDPYSRSKPAPKRLRSLHDSERKPQDSSNDESPDDQQPATQGDLPVKPFGFSILRVTAGIAATMAAALCTTGIVWIASISVSTASKVDVLLDRPPPVPLYQYEKDMLQLKQEVSDTKQRVTAIEQRQLDGLRGK
jgi:hypothetical protein